MPGLGPQRVAPVPVGRPPGVDRRPPRRGPHERRRVAPAVDRRRFQGVVRQRLRVRHEAARRGAAGKRRERLNAAKPPVPAPPSARQLSFEWGRRAEKRKPPEQARLDATRARSDELAAALDLADGFADLIRKRSPETLGEWLARGEASSDPDLLRFAEGLRRDEAAVHAAVTETWSNGPVEGHVNRLKTIKRPMYGRAGFVLLRARVLKAA